MCYDFNEDDDDPTPSRRDSHGTSAAGVAAADRDSTCGVGVAYNAGVAGLRLLGSWATDVEEAQALSYGCRDSIHIYRMAPERFHESHPESFLHEPSADSPSHYTLARMISRGADKEIRHMVMDPPKPILS